MDWLARGLAWWVEIKGFVPRGGCGGWDSALLASHNLGDASIVAAYFTIPLLMALFWVRLQARLTVEQRASTRNAGIVLWLFVAFISLCGVTHLTGALSTWYPAYRIFALLKITTGLVSWATIFTLALLIPLFVKASVKFVSQRESYDGNLGRRAKASN